MKNKILITGFLIVLLGVFVGCLGVTEMEVEEPEQEMGIAVEKIVKKPKVNQEKFEEEQKLAQEIYEEEDIERCDELESVNRLSCKINLINSLAVKDLDKEVCEQHESENDVANCKELVEMNLSDQGDGDAME